VEGGGVVHGCCVVNGGAACVDFGAAMGCGLY
jgi:hypothetical protein